MTPETRARRMLALALVLAPTVVACGKSSPARETSSSSGAGSGGSTGSGSTSSAVSSGSASGSGGAGGTNGTGGMSSSTDAGTSSGSTSSGSTSSGSTSSGSSSSGTGSTDGGPLHTLGGATLPAGWTLKVSDRFGTGAGRNVTSYSELHAKYNEGQFYNVDSNGLVEIPNTVINGEQETYVHFEQAIVFATDHLTIQGRGHTTGSIPLSSGEMVSLYTARSFCTEARYQIPSADKSWPAFWFYGSTSGSDTSELDVEQPVTPNQGVTSVSMYNHPSASSVTIADPAFTTAYMTWTKSSFDGSTAPHVYTTCYDDGSGQVTRFIDGALIYTAAWKWNASLGGTGHGPDACTIVNLAVGGDWPGNLADPTTYSGDLDLYSIDYYGP